VSCSVTLVGLVAYEVSLSIGAGSYSQRQLQSGNNFLGYNLFRPAAWIPESLRQPENPKASRDRRGSL
jgi:spore coat protein U-like protein